VMKYILNNNTSDVGTVPIVNGGSWEKYQDSEVIQIDLGAGVQTLRIYFKDHGFNLKSASLNLINSTVDKSDLEKAVASAKKRVSSDYTESSWTEFISAITASEKVLENENATQEEVQSALKDLRLAEIALEKVEEPKEVDKSELVKAVDSAKARVEEDYTPESWSVFEEAITTAEIVLANEEATQEEVQSALKDLRLAEIALEKVEEPKEVDKSELAKAVALAKKRNEANYTDESWKSFVIALKKAEKILADETATQKDIQKSLNNLLATENNLVEKVTIDE